MEIKEIYRLFLDSSGVCTDTRNIKKDSIFFALKGDNFNGNQFALQAIENGAAYAVVDEAIATHPKLIVVTAVLKTLQDLAAYHRAKLRCPVIAITGSNGKTTTKELLLAVLSTTYKTIATAGNLNNHIGVPLTLLSMPLDTEMAIVEMGANHQHEIEGYCTYAKPDFGLINNIGKAHLEGFGGEAGVRKGKTELYRYLAAANGTIFYYADDNIIVEEIAKIVAKTISYGTADTNFCTAKLLQGENKVAVNYNGTIIQSNLVGNYNFPNILAALAIGKFFDVNETAMKTAIEQYQPTINRSQQLTYKNATVILDAYNANPSSMREALQNFNTIPHPQKIAILGEMMELGEYSRAEHEAILQQLKKMQLTQIVLVGDGFSFAKNDFLWFENTAMVKDWLATQNIADSLILIKGSRKNALEKVIL